MKRYFILIWVFCALFVTSVPMTAAQTTMGINCAGYSGLAKLVCTYRAQLSTVRQAIRTPCDSLFGLEKTTCERNAAGGTVRNQQTRSVCTGLTGQDRRDCAQTLYVPKEVTTIDQRRNAPKYETPLENPCDRYAKNGEQYRDCVYNRAEKSNVIPSAPSRRQIVTTAQSLSSCRLIRERDASHACAAKAKGAALEVSKAYEEQRRTYARVRSLRWNKVYYDGVVE